MNTHAQLTNSLADVVAPSYAYPSGEWTGEHYRYGVSVILGRRPLSQIIDQVIAWRDGLIVNEICPGARRCDELKFENGTLTVWLFDTSDVLD